MNEADAKLRDEIWQRACAFDESPQEICMALAKRGTEIPVEQVRAVLEEQVEILSEDIRERRAHRIKAAASISSRRRLILSEIARLQRAQREQGGIKETVSSYGPKGDLKGTKVRTRDVALPLLAAERALGELDRFSASLNGLLKEDATREQTTIELRVATDAFTYENRT